MLGETFALPGKNPHLYALVLSNSAWNSIYEWSPITNFCQDDHKLCIKHELKKKWIKGIYLYLFSCIYIDIYIKMCMCDQVYFVPDLLRWSECEKCLFLLMRGPICAYTYKCTNKWHW